MGVGVGVGGAIGPESAGADLPRGEQTSASLAPPPTQSQAQATGARRLDSGRGRPWTDRNRLLGEWTLLLTRFEQSSASLGNI